MKSLNNQNQGFTILELLIATVVFSVIFLGASAAVLQIGKLYYKGVVTTQTQETVRSISDMVSQQLQFNAEPLSSKTTKSYPVINGPLSGNMVFSAYCIGGTRYSFVLNAKVSLGAVPSNAWIPSENRLNHALWRDTVDSDKVGTCVPADLSKVNPSSDTVNPGKGKNGQELLGANMRLISFLPACTGSSQVCSLSISVIYGDNDLMAPDSTNPTHCKSIIGNQWCATSQLSTSVIKRVGD